MMIIDRFVRGIAPVACVALLGFNLLANAVAGVTLVTHGLNGNVTGWVNSMVTNLPKYPAFRGTNYSGYDLAFSPAVGGGYTLGATRFAGGAPTNTDSGEIIVELDWSDLADGNSYNTYQVANAVVPALLSTNFIPELGGHAIAEFPLHLVGHSRGGSLWCEVSRLLGTNGIWVDHLTTLDPHPLNDPDFPFDLLAYRAVDAPANTYENVLFHDNYWQDLNALIRGKAVAGAYVRKLTNLDGANSSPHSDVHLWYHGTINTNTPASDTEATLQAAQRTAWWTTFEAQGAQAGFRYSLIGGADRTSMDQPVGPGFAMIRDGYNQWWDLGAGVANNRTALPANNGAWPNLIKFNRTATNQVAPGAALTLKFYYQWAQPASSLATISIYLDDDLNPLNTNQTLLRQITVPGNGAAAISFSTTNLTLVASNAAPGLHAVFAQITGGGRRRYLYAPELVEVVAARQPVALDITRVGPTEYRISVMGESGQTVVLQTSSDLVNWTSVATNTLNVARWEYTNSPPGALGARYYRAMSP